MKSSMIKGVSGPTMNTGFRFHNWYNLYYDMAYSIEAKGK